MTQDKGKVNFSYFKMEYEAFLKEHLLMWQIFNSGIKLYFVIVSFPLTVVLALRDVSKNIINSDKIFGHFLLIIGIVGLIFTIILIMFRLDIIMYARILNGLRGYWSKKNNEIRSMLKFAEVPSDKDIPQYFEMFRPMGFFVLLASIINYIYIFWGLIKILNLIYFEFNFLLSLLLFICLNFLVYKKCTLRSRIAGEETKKVTKEIEIVTRGEKIDDFI